MGPAKVLGVEHPGHTAESGRRSLKILRWSLASVGCGWRSLRGWQRFPLARILFVPRERAGVRRETLILCSLVVDFRYPDYPEVQVLESDFPYILCLAAIPSPPSV